jgi:hypothetical protein
MRRLIENAPDEKVKKYRQQFADRARERVVENVFPKIASHVAEHPRIVDQPPVLYHVSDPHFMEKIQEGLDAYRETLSDERRVLLDRYRLVDAALKVVGIGSVGTLPDRVDVLRRKPPADSADQGILPLGACALRGQEPLCQPGPARGHGPTADAILQRYLPRLGTRSLGRDFSSASCAT